MKKILLITLIICAVVSFIYAGPPPGLKQYIPVTTSPIPPDNNFDKLPEYVKAYFIKYNEYAIGDNPYNQYIPEPNALCFSGGGAKGVAYTGTLCYLKSAGILENVNKFSGASAGAIAAGLVSTCYRKGELVDGVFYNLIKVMMKMDYSSFIAKDQTFNKPIFKRLSKGLIPKLAAFVNIVTEINKHRGFISGDAIMDVFNKALKAMTGYENITLRQHYELTGVHLVLMSCSVCYRSSVVFDHNTVPDMPVALAMRASMAIPFCFTPVQCYGDWFVDGGTTNNYPVWYFDDKAAENTGTVGFVLDTGEDLVVKYKNLDGKDNFWAYLGKISGLLINNEQGVFLRNLKRSITINTGDVGTLSFNMTDQEELQAIYNGFMAAQDYFKTEHDFAPWHGMWDEVHGDSSYLDTLNLNIPIEDKLIPKGI